MAKRTKKIVRKGQEFSLSCQIWRKCKQQQRRFMDLAVENSTWGSRGKSFEWRSSTVSDTRTVQWSNPGLYDQRRAKSGFVDELLQSLQVVQSVVPLLHQNVRGQLTPKSIEVILVRGRTQNAMKIQILRGLFVVSDFVQAFGVVVASVQPLWLEVVIGGQVLLQLFVATRVLDLDGDFGVSENVWIKQNVKICTIQAFKL